MDIININKVLIKLSIKILNKPKDLEAPNMEVDKKLSLINNNNNNNKDIFRVLDQDNNPNKIDIINNNK
jgi:hypothetical protein